MNHDDDDSDYESHEKLPFLKKEEEEIIKYIMQNSLNVMLEFLFQRILIESNGAL